MTVAHAPPLLQAAPRGQECVGRSGSALPTDALPAHVAEPRLLLQALATGGGVGINAATPFTGGSTCLGACCSGACAPGHSTHSMGAEAGSGRPSGTGSAFDIASPSNGQSSHRGGRAGGGPTAGGSTGGGGKDLLGCSEQGSSNAVWLHAMCSYRGPVSVLGRMSRERGASLTSAGAAVLAEAALAVQDTGEAQGLRHLLVTLMALLTGEPSQAHWIQRTRPFNHHVSDSYGARLLCYAGMAQALCQAGVAEALLAWAMHPRSPGLVGWAKASAAGRKTAGT